MKDGLRLEHTKSGNHISEVIDSFSILSSNINHGDEKPTTMLTIIASRMNLSLKGETFVDNGSGAFMLQASGDDVLTEKVVYANLSCSIGVAKQLVDALNHTITQAEASLAAETVKHG